jgi:hypothetical protein
MHVFLEMNLLVVGCYVFVISKQLVALLIHIKSVFLLCVRTDAVTILFCVS